MFRPISIFALLGAVGVVGCGAESSEPGGDAQAGTGGSSGSGGSGGTGGFAAGTGGTDMGGTGGSAASNLEADFPDCSTEDNDEPCRPRGLPFVKQAFAHSFCTECVAPGGSLVFTQPEPGTLCLSGSMETEEPDAGGVVLEFPVYASEGLSPDHQTILERFNAEHLGITQLRFTVDRPPPGGVYLWAITLNKDECTAGDCVTGWFKIDFRTDFDEKGTLTIPFTDFVHEGGAVFDARSLGAIGIDVGPGAVDYCIRDFQFLDASGAVVEEQ